MPKVARTPPKQAEEGTTTGATGNLEALLLGMEGRLASKIDATNEKVDKALTLVDETNNALEELEHRVAASEEALESKLGKTEANI